MEAEPDQEKDLLSKHKEKIDPENPKMAIIYKEGNENPSSSIYKVSTFKSIVLCPSCVRFTSLGQCQNCSEECIFAGYEENFLSNTIENVSKCKNNISSFRKWLETSLQKCELSCEEDPQKIQDSVKKIHVDILSQTQTIFDFNICKRFLLQSDEKYEEINELLKDWECFIAKCLKTKKEAIVKIRGLFRKKIQLLKNMMDTGDLLIQRYSVLENCSEIPNEILLKLALHFLKNYKIFSNYVLNCENTANELEKKVPLFLRQNNYANKLKEYLRELDKRGKNIYDKFKALKEKVFSLLPSIEHAWNQAEERRKYWEKVCASDFNDLVKRQKFHSSEEKSQEQSVGRCVDVIDMSSWFRHEHSDNESSEAIEEESRTEESSTEEVSPPNKESITNEGSRGKCQSAIDESMKSCHEDDSDTDSYETIEEESVTNEESSAEDEEVNISDKESDESGKIIFIAPRKKHTMEVMSKLEKELLKGNRISYVPRKRILVLTKRLKKLLEKAECSIIFKKGNSLYRSVDDYVYESDVSLEDYSDIESGKEEIIFYTARREMSEDEKKLLHEEEKEMPETTEEIAVISADNKPTTDNQNKVVLKND